MNILRRYFTLKLYYNRSVSYFGWFQGIVEKGILIALLLKAYHLPTSVIILLAVGFLLFSFFVGYIDVRLGWAHLETTINNSINPQLMDIHQYTQRGRK